MGAAGWMAVEQHAWLAEFQRDPQLLLLRGDALSFYERAQDKRPFFAAHLREPLWPFSIRPFVTGDELVDAHRIRALTGVINILLLFAIGGLAWRLAGPLAGGFAAALVSGTPLTSYYGVSGLREPLMSLLLVTLTALWTCRLRALVVVGLLAVTAVIPLLRMEGLLVVPAISMVAALWRREKRAWLTALAASSVAWLTAAPYLANCQRQLGSAFAPLHQHARYWRNHEFAGRPGHLTREEVMADAYGGTPATSWAYALGDRSISEVVRRYATGYWLAFTDYVPRLLGRRWWLWLWPVGVIWACGKWRMAGLVVPVGLLVQFPFAFILPLNMVTAHGRWIGVEARFAWPLMPFVAVWAGLGFACLMGWLHRVWLGWRGHRIAGLHAGGLVVSFFSPTGV